MAAFYSVIDHVWGLWISGVIMRTAPCYEQGRTKTYRIHRHKLKFDESAQNSLKTYSD